MSTLKPLTIDVVSDVVCPWCYIGKKRLDEARALAPDLDVVVRFRPYQLDATIPPEGISRKEGITERVGGGGVAGQTYETIESLQGVVQLDKLNEKHALIVVQTEDSPARLQTVALP